MSGWIVSVALVGAVTGLLALLEGHAPVSSLVVLYMLVVLPVAVVWGASFGIGVTLASAAVFDYLYVEPRGTFIPADSRQWVGLAAFVLTGTASSELAARSRERAREVERIFDLSLDLLCIAGLDGRFLRVNPAFERTLGYTRRQLLSRPFLELVHPEDQERTQGMMDALVRGEQILQF